MLPLPLALLRTATSPRSTRYKTNSTPLFPTWSRERGRATRAGQRTEQVDVATGTVRKDFKKDSKGDHQKDSDLKAVPAEAFCAFCWRPSGVLRFPERGLQARSIMPVLAHVCVVRHRQALQRMRLRQRQPDTLNMVSIFDHSDLTNCSTRDFADAPLWDFIMLMFFESRESADEIRAFLTMCSQSPFGISRRPRTCWIGRAISREQRIRAICTRMKCPSHCASCPTLTVSETLFGKVGQNFKSKEIAKSSGDHFHVIVGARFPNTQTGDNRDELRGSGFHHTRCSFSSPNSISTSMAKTPLRKGFQRRTSTCTTPRDRHKYAQHRACSLSFDRRGLMPFGCFNRCFPSVFLGFHVPGSWLDPTSFVSTCFGLQRWLEVVALDLFWFVKFARKGASYRTPPRCYHHRPGMATPR